MWLPDFARRPSVPVPVPLRPGRQGLLDRLRRALRRLAILSVVPFMV